MKPTLQPSHWIVACLVLLIAYPSFAQTSGAPEVTRERSVKAIYTSQLNTVAVCGHPSCDCGPFKRISREGGPCKATAATGSCQVGSGECCVCEAPASTTAVCSGGSNFCHCESGTQVAKVNAPCTVTSNAGSCHVGSGECCVCTSK